MRLVALRGGASDDEVLRTAQDVEDFEQEIVDEYAWEELGTPLSVTCPDVASTAPGSTITCAIVLADRTDTWIAEYYEDGMYMVSTSSIQN